MDWVKTLIIYAPITINYFILIALNIKTNEKITRTYIELEDLHQRLCAIEERSIGLKPLEAKKQDP